jgi:superfamily II DNA helicase RecQ
LFSIPYSIRESANFIANITSIADCFQQVFGHTPRPEQLEAIKTLVVDQKDLVLIAKTGFGKSLVFNSVPFLRGGVALIIMPLNAIEEDQTAALLRVVNRARCSPVILNGDSNTSELRANIQKGHYSHSLYFLCPYPDPSVLIADSIP